jgi:hypothetical protein
MTKNWQQFTAEKNAFFDENFHGIQAKSEAFTPQKRSSTSKHDS